MRTAPSITDMQVRGHVTIEIKIEELYLSEDR